MTLRGYLVSSTTYFVSSNLKWNVEEYMDQEILAKAQAWSEDQHFDIEFRKEIKELITTMKDIPKAKRRTRIMAHNVQGLYTSHPWLKITRHYS